MHNRLRRIRSLVDALAGAVSAPPHAAAAAAAAVEEPTPTPGSSDEWAALHPHAALGDANGLSEAQLNEWCSRGMVVLPEEQMGLPPGWHDRLRETALAEPYGMYDFCDVLPIGELMTAPGVVAGVASLLGPNWAIVPFANGSAGGNKMGPADGSPGGDQHWVGVHCTLALLSHEVPPVADSLLQLATTACVAQGRQHAV
eukprot:SAG31_NODE_3547_length_4135_cov_4.829534_6_plen_200_part_00